MKNVEFSDLVFIVAITAVLSLVVGGAVVKDIDDGTHSYYAVRIISTSNNTVVRAVESPASKDDRTVETIINGKLVSRTKPEGFDRIWESAK